MALSDFFIFVVVIMVAGLGFFLLFRQHDSLPTGLQTIELVSPQGVIVARNTCELQEECEIARFSDALFSACGFNWTFRAKVAEASGVIPVTSKQYRDAMLSRKGRVFSACEGANTISNGTLMRVCGNYSIFVGTEIPIDLLQNEESVVIGDKSWRCSGGVLISYET